MSKSPFRKKSIASLQHDESDHSSGLHRVLTVRDLTFFGIAAILGAGSFSSLGGAVFNGGPGVILLFVITAIACAFTAYCYSEFASRIPVAGSAYTYAYASFGELFAWIIGWALIMEYSIGNIYVAYSWSDYFTSLMDKCGWHIPTYLSCSYMEAKHAIAGGSTSGDAVAAWNNAPMLGGLRIIADIPAFCINILITILVYRGVKESKNFSNLMVVLKMLVVLLVIVVGGVLVFKNDLTANWLPSNNAGVSSFLPNGFSGVMMAVSGVFFAYIGFDAVSVLAEESKNPQRDLPRGMLLSLVICTVVYILLTLVLTGALDYRFFEGVGDPLAFIFEPQNLNVGWMQFLVAICAVVAMTSVLLVFQMGQPRIWMSISRDGLLPPVFQKVHPKYKTPSFATILTGIVVGLPIFFTDKTFVLDFTSIATLFAFVLVCGGVLLLPYRAKEAGKFHLPFVNAKYIFPILIAGAIGLISILFPKYFQNLTTFSLLPETQEETIKAYNRSLLSDFTSQNLLDRKDVLYLGKIDKQGPAVEEAKKVAQQNDAVMDAMVNDLSIAQNAQLNGQLLNANATAVDCKAYIERAPKLNADFKKIFASLTVERDSLLMTKIYRQQALSKAFSDDVSMSSIWQDEVTNAISKFSADDLKSELSGKLEVQRVFNFSSIAFWMTCLVLSVFCLMRKWSLIPLLGLVSCAYLLTGMSMSNWIWFIGWLILGLVVYFLYGYKNSKINKSV